MKKNAQWENLIKNLLREKQQATSYLSEWENMGNSVFNFYSSLVNKVCLSVD
jgi:hypothetical protein